ncbi:MAG TPA: substrate-binding domain-containing protein, partial [Negativicutes bacterium]|nr:substrate-binding domain-containing protein [Negativicutes bacterium]
MEKGARKAEEEFGINLIVKTGAKETSIDQQIAIVEEMIESGVDAIVIAPGSSTELIPVLKKAQDAGIKIINIDNKLDEKVSEAAGLKDVPFISVDNESSAYMSCKYIVDKAKGPVEAVLIEGIRGADNAEMRKKGALRAMKENTAVKVVAMESANWKIDESYDVIEKIYEKHPKVKLIFCANDMMALGVLQYLEKYGKDDVLVAGFDALEEAKEAISKGKLQTTVNQQADVQGYTGVKYAVEMLKGTMPPLETMVEAKLITQENAGE